MKPLTFVLLMMPTTGLCDVAILSEVGSWSLQLHTDAQGEPSACVATTENEEVQNFQVVYMGNDPVPNFMIGDTSWQLGPRRIGPISMSADAFDIQMDAEFRQNLLILLPLDGPSAFDFLHILELSDNLELKGAAGHNIAVFPLTDFPEVVERIETCVEFNLFTPDPDPFR